MCCVVRLNSILTHGDARNTATIDTLGGMNYLDYPVLGKVGGSWRIANYANPTLETAFAPKLKVVGSTFYSGHCRGLKIYKFPSLTTVGGKGATTARHCTAMH